MSSTTFQITLSIYLYIENCKYMVKRFKLDPTPSKIKFSYLLVGIQHSCICIASLK